MKRTRKLVVVRAANRAYELAEKRERRMFDRHSWAVEHVRFMSQMKDAVSVFAQLFSEANAMYEMAGQLHRYGKEHRESILRGDGGR